MRILFWVDNFFPGIGGVEVLGAALIRSLVARGHKLVIVGGPYLPETSDPTTFEGVPVYRFPFEFLVRPSGPEMVGRIKRQLNELKQSFRPDVVHMFQTMTGFVFHLETDKAFPAPTLLSLHGNLLDDTPQVTTARRQLLIRVNAIAACSRATRDELLAQMPELEYKTTVVTNALPLPSLTPAPLNFEPPRIVCLGRLHPQKGFDVAVEAFAKIRAHLPQARLLIAGDGAERQALQAQVARLDLSDAVEICGWVPPPRIPEFLNQATLVLMPSRWEPFGLVALQAAQMGRPVIASRVGGLPEIIADGETGLLVESEDVDALANSIKALLENPIHSIAMGNAARKRALSAFPWDTFVDGYEALYSKLLSGARA